jgi:hypothetical protein
VKNGEWGLPLDQDEGAHAAIFGDEAIGTDIKARIVASAGDGLSG